MAAGRIPYLLGHGEIAMLYEVKNQTSQAWKTRGVLGEPDVLASGNPYWLLGTVLDRLGAAGRAVSAERLAEYEASIPDGYQADEPSQLPIIVGIKEVARLLDVTPLTVGRWRDRGRIADEDLNLSKSPLWLLDTILADATRRERDVVAGEVERLREGEREPQRPRGRRGAPPSDQPET